eukprot:gene5608-biopygen8330
MLCACYEDGARRWGAARPRGPAPSAARLGSVGTASDWTVRGTRTSGGLIDRNGAVLAPSAGTGRNGDELAEGWIVEQVGLQAPPSSVRFRPGKARPVPPFRPEQSGWSGAPRAIRGRDS